jgi:GDP-L-fucose synthase
VIPALIRRVVEARRSGADELVIWGTGQASREFLYVEDCARALLLAAEHYDDPDPVNLGMGSEIRIAEVAALIAELAGFQGRFVYDATKPDGQPRRCLDTAKALALFGFRARMGVRTGLERTIEWYMANGSDA